MIALKVTTGFSENHHTTGLNHGDLSIPFLPPNQRKGIGQGDKRPHLKSAAETTG